MKNNKKFILGLLTGVILASTLSVVAVKMTAKEIGFKSSDETWQVNNVEDAVNSLYNESKNSINGYHFSKIKVSGIFYEANNTTYGGATENTITLDVDKLSTLTINSTSNTGSNYWSRKCNIKSGDEVIATINVPSTEVQTFDISSYDEITFDLNWSERGVNKQYATVVLNDVNIY